MAEKIGPKKAKEQIENEKEENKEFIKDLIPFLADPNYLNDLIPPLICGPDSPNGMVKIQQPSVAYMFDNILGATFENVEKTFNKDIKKFKIMIMGEDVPWKEFDADVMHETFGDSVSTWLDILISLILPFADDPEKAKRKESNALNNSLSGQNPEDKLFVAKELREILSMGNSEMTFFPSEEHEGFEISFNNGDRKVRYYENATLEPIELPIEKEHADGTLSPIILAGGDYRTDLLYLNKFGKMLTIAAKTGTLKAWGGDPTPGNEDDEFEPEKTYLSRKQMLKKYIFQGPMQKWKVPTSSGIAPLWPFLSKTKILDTPEIGQLYEILLKSVYKRFAESTSSSGFFRRNIFKRLKLESGPPPAAPAQVNPDNPEECIQVVTDDELKNPDFMNAAVFVEKVKKRREALECLVEDPEEQALREAVVEMYVRLQTINVFIKLLFAISLFDFDTVLESDIVKAFIDKEIKEDFLKTGGNLGGTVTQQRLSREIQKIAIGLIETKEQELKTKAEQSAVNPELSDDTSLKDPITGNTVHIDTGTQALHFLAKNEISDVKSLFEEKMKHLIPLTSVFTRPKHGEKPATGDTFKINQYFDRIAYPEFVEMPYGINHKDKFIHDLGYFGAHAIPIEIKELAPPEDSDFPNKDRYPRYEKINEIAGLDGGLFYERYVKINPKRIKETPVYDEVLDFLYKIEGTPGAIALTKLLNIGTNQFGDAEEVDEHEQWSLKGKINLRRSTDFYSFIPRIDPFSPAQKTAILGTGGNVPGIDLSPVHFAQWSQIMNRPYTDFFEPVTFGVRLCIVARNIPESFDLDFIKNALGSGLSDDALLVNGPALEKIILEEKVMIMNQSGGERYLVLPLLEKEIPAVPDNTTIQDFAMGQASTLSGAIKLFKTKAASESGLATATDLKNFIQNEAQTYGGLTGESLINEVFDMDRFYSAMTAHHIVAFDNVYPEMIDLFNNTKVQLGALINIITNLGKFQEPAMDELDMDADVEPWWENFDIDWKEVPIFLLQMLASMVDPTWKTPWLWKGGPGPITPIGIAAKLLGDDPTGDEEVLNEEILAECSDSIKARAEAAKTALKNAADAISSASDDSTLELGIYSTFWKDQTIEDQQNLLRFHMGDILQKNTQTSRSYMYDKHPSALVGNKDIPSIRVFGGFFFTPDSGIDSEFELRGTAGFDNGDPNMNLPGAFKTAEEKYGERTFEEVLVEAQFADIPEAVKDKDDNWVYKGGGIGWDGHVNDSHAGFATTFLSKKPTYPKAIVDLVNKYLVGYYGILAAPPSGFYGDQSDDRFTHHGGNPIGPESPYYDKDAGKGKLIPIGHWKGMDEGLIELRNALVRFITGLKMNTYNDGRPQNPAGKVGDGAQRRYCLLPMDFVWIPNRSPHDQQWNSDGRDLTGPTSEPHPDEKDKYKSFARFYDQKGWSNGGGNVVPALVADITNALGYNHAFSVGVVSKEAFGDTSLKNKGLHKDTMVWEYFTQHGEGEFDGMNKVKKRSNVYTVPNVNNPDENLETTHGIGEFYVFHPTAGEENKGAWINLPHLSWYHLSKNYFTKDPEPGYGLAALKDGSIRHHGGYVEHQSKTTALEITQVNQLDGWAYYSPWGWTMPHPEAGSATKAAVVYDGWRNHPPEHMHPEYKERW